MASKCCLHLPARQKGTQERNEKKERDEMRIVIAGSEFPLMGKKIPMCVVRHRKKARPSNIIRRCAGMIAPSRSSWPAHSTAGFLTPFAHLRQCRDIRRQQPPEANRLVHALRARSLRLIAHRNVVSAKSCAPLQRLRERPTSRLHAASNLSGRTFVFFGQPGFIFEKAQLPTVFIEGRQFCCSSSK